jgi:GNAT superfamily N-acetyltransferase
MQPERICDPADLEEIYVLRVAAWRARVESFPDIGRWTDAEDARAAHWAIRDDGRIVAAARLSIYDSLAEVPHAEIFDGVFSRMMEGPIASLNRLVVAPSHSGKGFSEALDRVRVGHARDMKCRHAIGETFSAARVSQLGTLGFQAAGSARPYRSGPLAVVSGDPSTAERAAPVAIVIHLSIDAVV